MISVLVSLCISYFLFAGQPHEGIVSWAYFPLAALTLVKPFVTTDELTILPDSRWAMVRLGALVSFMVIGPTLIAKYLPTFDIAPMWLAPACVLLGAIGASGLFFAAILSRIDSAPQTAVSCDQTTIGMNCQPSQLWTAIGRDFQDKWARGIPNRQYTNVEPVALQGQGAFTGNVLEETQPTPTNSVESSNIREALKSEPTRYLVLLCFWATLMAIAAVGVAAYAANHYPTMTKMEMSRSLLTIIAFETVSLLAFKLGHLLWSRMYFKSRLTWIEVAGTYQTAELDIGNQLTGNARSKSTVIKIEDATLRVWVTDIVTVVFGKESPRFIMAMAPADGAAASVARRLKEFANDQSMVIAPTSNRDAQKAAALRAMNNIYATGEIPTNAMAAASFLENEPDVRNGDENISFVEDVLHGTVKFYHKKDNYGYVVGQNGSEHKFTQSNLQNCASVSDGDKVRFNLAQQGDRQIAENIFKVE